jgi:hypothetical protein
MLLPSTEYQHMDQQSRASDEQWEPSAACRFTVEAAMLEMVQRLERQGLGNEEVALALVDAAEDYVIRLAKATSQLRSGGSRLTQSH